MLEFQSELQSWWYPCVPTAVGLSRAERVCSMVAFNPSSSPQPLADRLAYLLLRMRLVRYFSHNHRALGAAHPQSPSGAVPSRVLKGWRSLLVRMVVVSAAVMSGPAAAATVDAVCMFQGWRDSPPSGAMHQRAQQRQHADGNCLHCHRLQHHTSYSCYATAANRQQRGGRKGHRWHIAHMHSFWVGRETPRVLGLY